MSPGVKNIANPKKVGTLCEHEVYCGFSGFRLRNPRISNQNTSVSGLSSSGLFVTKDQKVKRLHVENHKKSSDGNFGIIQTHSFPSLCPSHCPILPGQARPVHRYKHLIRPVSPYLALYTAVKHARHTVQHQNSSNLLFLYGRPRS